MSLRFITKLPARVLLSVLLAICIWLGSSFGLLESTVVPGLDQQLRDFYLSLTVDSRKDNGPGLLHLTYNNEALAAHGLPERVPARAIQESLDLARTSNQAVVLDIDLATRSDVTEMEGLAAYLVDWGKDPNAALLLLAYPQYEVSYRDIEAFRTVDKIVRASPNIRWAGVGSLADADGIIRNHEFWSCNASATAKEFLPSAALYIWLRAAADSPAQAIEILEAGLRNSGNPCNGGSEPVFRVGTADSMVPRQGLIEYQASIDALDAAEGEQGQYASDGMPRLFSIGYCQISPQSCGSKAGPTRSGGLVQNRIVLISAANDFSRDEHLTPVGILTGSVILGNAGRALIVSGPPNPASKIRQLIMLLAAVGAVWAVWGVMDKSRCNIRAKDDRPLLRKCQYGFTNPAIVQWLAFAAADAIILVYYYFDFSSSEWSGLVGASFGVTTVAAIAAFQDWMTTPWDKKRLEE